MLEDPFVVITLLVFGALEWIGTQVEQLGRTQLNQRLHPDLEALRWLLHEHRLVLVVAEACEVAVIGPVIKFVALVGSLAGKQVALVVAVEVHLVGLVTDGLALQQFVLDVGIASRSDESLYPVFSRNDVVYF